MELEGSEGKLSQIAGGRLTQPFSPFLVPAGEHRCFGYLLRLPSHEGHWVSILPSSILHFNPAHPYHPIGSANAAALLCDSLFPCPFELTSGDVENLLTACAIDSSTSNLCLFQGEWGCFLIGDLLERLQA